MRTNAVLSCVLVGIVCRPAEMVRPDTPQPATPMFKTQTELVMLTATVLRPDGRPVVDLRQSDFRIREGGRVQEIAFFAVGEEMPISLVIAIDTSGSMVDKLDDVRDAVQHLLARSQPADEIALVRFSDSATLVAEGVSASDPRLRAALERLEGSGSTALYDAVAEGLDVARRGRRRKKVLLVVTDGRDTSSSIGRRQVVALAKRAEVLVYGLGIGERREPQAPRAGGHADSVDINALTELAGPSGGRAYRVDSPHESGIDRLDQAIAGIGQELRLQYTLGYYPPPGDTVPAYRRITVDASNPAWIVRARAGYWTPGRQALP